MFILQLGMHPCICEENSQRQKSGHLEALLRISTGNFPKLIDFPVMLLFILPNVQKNKRSKKYIMADFCIFFNNMSEIVYSFS